MSSTGETGPHDLPEEAVRYVLGEMTRDEQLAFEVRLSGDAALGRRVAAAMALDELLQRAATATRGAAADRAVPRPGLRWQVPLLAAALLIAAGATWWLLRSDAAPSLRVAIAASSPSYRQLVERLGVPADRAPVEALRTGGTPPADAAERVDGLLQRAGQDVERSLDRGAVEVVGEAFVVPIANEREVWALVLASFPDGGRRLYYPDPDSSPDQDAQDGRLAPGRHVLPTGRVSATDEQRSLGVVTFTPGFVLPLRADGAVVFVAVSGAAWTDTTLRQLRELADGTGSEQDTRQRLQQILPQASIAELRVRTE